MIGRNGPKSPKKTSDLRLLADGEDKPEATCDALSAGTDLAKFAEDVIALNRQAGLSPSSTMPNRHIFQVAPLESLSSRPKLKKQVPGEPELKTQVAELRRLRKE